MKKKYLLDIQRINNPGVRLNQFLRDKHLKSERLKNRNEAGFIEMRSGQI